MAVKKDLTGKRFGSLTVIALEVDTPGKKKKWRCVCDCGNETIVAGSNLVSGHTKHCVLCGYKATGKASITHEKKKKKLYFVWNAIKTRCENEKSKSYRDYGGRGIKLCTESHDPSEFIQWALKSGYKYGYEIDRIDVNGDYEPNNCRWITKEENANNKRNNKAIEYNGEKKTLAQWARYFEVNYKNLSRNIIKGYGLEDAVKRIKSGDRSHRGSKKWNEKY